MSISTFWLIFMTFWLDFTDRFRLSQD